MHIAIDASRTTLARRTGTEQYALALIRALLSLDSPHQFSLYFRDAPPAGLLPEGPNITYRVLPFLRLWTHLRFAAALWQERPDVTFVPAHVLPITFPGPAVVTVHDLGYHYYPEAHQWLSRDYLEWSTRRSASRASVILADSKATLRDLETFYGTPPDKVRVVYPGVDESLQRITDQDALQQVRTRYGLPERYLLFLGTLQPRKNIARIAQAYQLSGLHSQGVGLVLAGAPGWLYSPRWTADVPGVLETGYVDEADITALYSGADVLVFPTLFEGFGFPVLEAMRCGTPVITSTTSSLPEVGGESALQVDPEDVRALAEAIQRVVSDSALRAQMVETGYAHAAQFTWRNAAEATMLALEEAATH